MQGQKHCKDRSIRRRSSGSKVVRRRTSSWDFDNASLNCTYKHTCHDHDTQSGYEGTAMKSGISTSRFWVEKGGRKHRNVSVFLLADSYGPGLNT